MQTVSDLRVLEISGSPAGAYAAKVFADAGATVVKVEPEAGDPSRHRVVPETDVSPEFVYLNAGKRSLATPSGRPGAAWLAWADVLIESSAPDPLPPAPRELPPELVHVRISPFGSGGPYASFRSTPFTDEAIAGHLYLNGEPDREPVQRPGLHAHYQAGLQGAIGALAALRARDHTGRGQTVEVTHFEGLASLHQHTWSMWSHGRYVLRREGNRQPGIWHPIGVYPCKDGHVMLAIPAHAMVDRFLVAAGLPELLLDARFANDAALGQHKDEFDAAILPWLLAHTAAEIIEVAQAAGAPVGPVPSPLEVLSDPQLAARDAWASACDLRLPRSPLRCDPLEKTPPALGESAEPPDRDPRPRDLAEPGTSVGDGSLAGIRVLDLSRVWAGPLAGRLLADLGADVIAVEHGFARGPREVSPEAARILHMFPDDEPGERPWNRVGGVNELLRNKRSVTLDLKDLRAKEVFEALVKESDVVLENFSPRVMPGLGLGAERLAALNPRLVYTQISGYGATGPQRDYLAFGPLLEAGSGVTHGLGYEGGGPLRAGIAWADPVSALHAVAATLAALRDRDTTGEGASVDLSMHEAMLAFSGERIARAALTGECPPRLGNRDPRLAPQGVYPAAGEDRWIAISVTSEAEWAALVRAAKLPTRWSEWSLDARRVHHDEIDAALATFTRTRDPHETMRGLQAEGVIAAVVADARDLARDPQLHARGFLVEIDHPEAGRHAEPGCAIRLSEPPLRLRRPAPCLGQHNAEVLRQVLDYDAARIAELEAAGVLIDAPPG